MPEIPSEGLEGPNFKVLSSEQLSTIEMIQQKTTDILDFAYTVLKNTDFPDCEETVCYVHCDPEIDTSISYTLCQGDTDTQLLFDEGENVLAIAIYPGEETEEGEWLPMSVRFSEPLEITADHLGTKDSLQEAIAAQDAIIIDEDRVHSKVMLIQNRTLREINHLEAGSDDNRTKIDKLYRLLEEFLHSPDCNPTTTQNRLGSFTLKNTVPLTQDLARRLMAEQEKVIRRQLS